MRNLAGGVDGVKIIENMGSQNVPKVDFCYIVVSTFFGPSGPPPDPPKSDIFGPPFWEKYSLFVGNGIFIGPILGVDFGVEKWGSFCRKLQNFKKFIIWGVRVPGIEKRRFLSFWPPRKFDHFWRFLGRFLPLRFWSFLTSIFIILSSIYKPSIFDIF
jgi:hypothetical protein